VRSMKRFAVAQLFVALAIMASTCRAQPEAPRYNFTLGGGVGFPQGSTSDFANSGGNFVVGGGVNTGPAIGFDGEFMWHDLPPKTAVVAATGAPDGAARLYAVTANVILHAPERAKLGGYGILGGGWYHRSWELTHPSLAIGTTCLPTYVWWGVVCGNGIVESTTKIAGNSRDGGGWNAGAGVTYRIGESHAKIYAEARFHYAYFSGINTRIIPLTFGFKF